jgi:hypothetical protein
MFANINVAATLGKENFSQSFYFNNGWRKPYVEVQNGNFEDLIDILPITYVEKVQTSLFVILRFHAL